MLAIHLHHPNWWKEYVLPGLAIFMPIVLSVFGAGPQLVLMFPVALAMGYLVRPRHVWVLWIVAIVMVWTIYGFATLVGALPEPGEGENQETVWSFMFEVVVFMAGLVLLPMWIGRSMHRLRTRLREPE